MDPNCPRQGACFRLHNGLCRDALSFDTHCICTVCDECIETAQLRLELHLQVHDDCSEECSDYQTFIGRLDKLRKGLCEDGCRCPAKSAKSAYIEHRKSCKECMDPVLIKQFNDCTCTLITFRCFNYRVCGDVFDLHPPNIYVHNGACTDCRMTYGNISQSTESMECPICLETKNDNIKMGRCRHYICADCAKVILKAKKTCPLCRAENVPICQ